MLRYLGNGPASHPVGSLHVCQPGPGLYRRDEGGGSDHPHRRGRHHRRGCLRQQHQPSRHQSAHGPGSQRLDARHAHHAESLGVTPDFLIYHRYEQAPGQESDAELLQCRPTWPNDAADLRQQLSDYLGTAGTGSNSSSPKTTRSTPIPASRPRASSTASFSPTASATCCRPNSTPCSGGTCATGRTTPTTTARRCTAGAITATTACCPLRPASAPPPTTIRIRPTM